MSMLSLLESVSKEVQLSPISTYDEERTTTGLLCMDLMCGGGLAPCWITYAGPEQSAKTTFALQVLATQLYNSDIPIKVLWDAEQSTGQSLDYFCNIVNQTLGPKKAKALDPSDVFGSRDKTGSFVSEPLIYYRDDTDGQKFFTWTYNVFKSLPDKRKLGDDWYYVHEVTTDNKKKFKGAYDVKLSQKHGGLWVPAKDGSPQVLIFCDSLPALVPPSMTEGEGSNQLAQNAAMFAKYVPRIKGLFGAKRIVFMAVNQLRDNPGARFSSPTYEPLGRAIAYFSDVRLWFWPNALSTAPFKPKGEGLVETEQSIEVDGVDTYRYIKVSPKKNKLSAHVKETWLRLWVSDSSGNALGFDPVWDCFYYGISTGQIVGDRKKMRFAIDGFEPSTTAISWMELKNIILAPRDPETLPIFHKLGFKKPVDFRAGFRRQVASGRGYELLILKQSEERKKKSADSIEDNDDE